MSGYTDSAALHTDRYEFTMLDAAIADGTVNRKAVFEAFARRLPDGARYGLVAGTDRVITAAQNFRFDDETVAWLLKEGVVGRETAKYLKDFRFSGTVSGLQDGDVWFPGTPLVTVTGTFGEAVLLETVILSALNHGCTIATHAAMYREAADNPQSNTPGTLIEMGSRRTHETTAVDTARAAVIGGFDATSNLEAARRFGIPSTGTAAHAWTLAHPGPEGEIEAFVAQIQALGVGTTLLVDTFDIEQGIRNAVEAARRFGADGPGGIRIDSGDLRAEATTARDLLNRLGAWATTIVVSGDLDVTAVRALAEDFYARVYGVGTKLVAAHPVGVVYKLVEIEGSDGQMVPVEKKSATVGKATVGGAKRLVRTYGPGGEITGEYHLLAGADAPAGARTVQVRYDLALPVRNRANTTIAVRRARATRASVADTITPVVVPAAPAPTPAPVAA